MGKRNLTKEAFADAIQSLLSARDIDDITVREILDKCDLSKRTFYNYFADKYELAAYAWMRFFNQSWISGDRQATFEEFFDNYFEIQKRHKGFFMHALSDNPMNQNSIWHAIESRSIEAYIDCIKRNGYGAMIDSYIMAQIAFVTYGCIGIVQDMYRDLRNHRIQEINPPTSNFFVDILPEPLKTYTTSKRVD